MFATFAIVFAAFGHGLLPSPDAISHALPLAAHFVGGVLATVQPSYDVTELTANLLSMSESMFNSLIPVVGIVAGISLGIGLVGKILSAIRSAF